MGDISKNFNRKEFKCPDCDFSTTDIELINVLEKIREHFKKPIKINSGCRCDTYNKKINGSKNSKHKEGIAADIFIKGINQNEVYSFLINQYPDKYGIGKYNTFTHIDIRKNKARW